MNPIIVTTTYRKTSWAFAVAMPPHVCHPSGHSLVATQVTLT